MRPLELNLRNFRSYFGDGHSFDFRDRHLVGVVGPIGAGKSTILDAIAFALYGRTPRVNRGTKSLIHQRADDAAVQFRFAVDDQVWEAVRSIRKKGQSQHALYRYESDDPDAEPVEKILQEGEVNERIETLLGFDYAAFGRSVLLAQGQFADFLTARPAERDRVLRGLFGHDRIEAMRDIAKQKVSAQTHEIDLVAVRLEAAAAAEGRLATQRESLAAASARAERLAAAEEEITTLVRTIAAADGRRAEATRHLEELNRLAERMPDAATSETVTTRAAEARQTRAALATEHDEVHQSMAAAEQALKSEEHLDRMRRIESGASLIARLEVKQAALETAVVQMEAGEERAAKAAADLADAEAAVARTTDDVRAAIEHVEAARAAHQAAEDRLHAARHADMAATLRAGLAVGDPCPVCRQEVGDLTGDGAEDLAAAEQALHAARAALDTAGRAGLTARGALEAAQAKRTASSQRVAELTKDNRRLADDLSAARGAVTGAESELVELLGAGDPVELLAAAKAEAGEAVEAVEVARRKVEEARRALDAAIATEQEADRALGDLRTQLGALAGRLDADADVPDDDPAALAAALADLRDRWVVRTKELAEEQATAADEVEAASVRHRSLLADLEVDGEFAAALAAARTQAEMLAARVAEDEQVVAASADLMTRRDELQASVASFRRLQSDLTDARFIRYLLDEERVILAELGSEHFQRLSSGRYRFSDKGDFAIVDLTAADAVRTADSLSGGETFLASLGLALGLAEMVGRTGGRLEAFFLDEGFGTLDPEHLDLAMEGIEALVADHPNRLVVVVSHVPELRHRIEDLIQLERNPVTGDSIVQAGASPV